MQEEIWKDIPNYEGYYQVSNLGRVKSLKRNRSPKEKILKSSKTKNGYLSNTLSKNNKQKSYFLHQLVAMAFLDHKPNRGKIVVDHIDNNKTNNKLSNIQVVSQRVNASKDKFRIKRTSKYVGVNKSHKGNKWIAKIHIGKTIHLGRFDTEEEASEAYQAKLKEIT